MPPTRNNIIMDKDLKIGIFNECFPPVMDGVSVCAENYAYWLQKKIGDVGVITPNVPGTDYSNLDYEVLTYPSVSVPFRPPYKTGIADIQPLYINKLLNRHFRIVHAHSPFSSGRAALRVAKGQNIPIVATFHSKYRDDFIRVLKSGIVVDELIRNIIDFYQRVDEVWVPQASVKDVIYEYGFKGEVSVVDNGSDLVADYPDSYFTDAKAKLGVDKNALVLLFVGQHIWEKGTRLIIDTLERIKDLPFRMFFVGTGYAADEMKRLVREKGLEDRTTFTGVLTDRESMKTYYAAADLFLFPSLYDNAPLVVREAAALHTPAVMVQGSTAATILKDDFNGFLIENSIDSFEQKLRALESDRAKIAKVGVEASHTIVRSWENVVDEVIERYRDLIRLKKMI